MLTSASSLGGGGGGGGSGIFCVTLCSELVLTEISFPSHILVVDYALTTCRLGLTYSVDVQLHCFL